MEILFKVMVVTEFQPPFGKIEGEKGWGRDLKEWRSGHDQNGCGGYEKNRQKILRR